MSFIFIHPDPRLLSSTSFAQRCRFHLSQLCILCSFLGNDRHILTDGGISCRLYPQLRNVRCIANAVRADNEPFTAPQGRRLLAIGRIILEKGFDLAIDAMPHILAHVPDAELVIAGDGPERADLQAKVCALGLTRHLSLPGWTPPEAVLREMCGAMAVLVPSRWNEPFGLVALEAAWAGRPVIALNRGGLPEIVRDGETGFLVPGEDPAASLQLPCGCCMYLQGSSGEPHASTPKPPSILQDSSRTMSRSTRASYPVSTE